jgi:hypothetical protein
MLGRGSLQQDGGLHRRGLHSRGLWDRLRLLRQGFAEAHVGGCGLHDGHGLLGFRGGRSSRGTHGVRAEHGLVSGCCGLLLLHAVVLLEERGRGRLLVVLGASQRAV